MFPWLHVTMLSHNLLKSFSLQLSRGVNQKNHPPSDNLETELRWMDIFPLNRALSKVSLDYHYKSKFGGASNITFFRTRGLMSYKCCIFTSLCEIMYFFVHNK